MRSNRVGRPLAVFSLLLTFPATVVAAFTIDDVMNAASRIPTGFNGSGIAQGALFVVSGKGVGPELPVQASFPLPAVDGLGGVSIKVTVGGATLDAFMVSASANEVSAILPSATPLGTGTVTVTNGDSMATAPLMVVKSAFGIFNAFSPGLGPALAFNVGPDGGTAFNTFTQSAQAGQNVTINGTGLGAISSDETQTGATEASSADVKVWVGSKQATVVSAGRGSCCTGLDFTYPVPQGIAAWDVIVFTVPEGIEGCLVSVAVQIADKVSNAGSISVTPGGGTCAELKALNPGGLITLPGNAKFGLISLIRAATKVAASGVTIDTTVDAGAASFTQVDLGPNPGQVSTLALSGFLDAGAGSCSVIIARVTSAPVPVPAVVFLDAGPVINLKGPNGAKPMPKQRDGTYSAVLANVTNLPTFPGLPPISTGGPGFLEAGAFTADNGSGGSDIPAFNISWSNPKPITWDNMDQITAVNRAQGVTVRWSGGDPDGLVRISGTATQIQGNIVFFGSFTCTERVSAGQFAVPPFVTLQLPQVNSALSATGQGSLQLVTILGKTVTIPRVDLTQLISTASASKNVSYP